MDKKINSFKKVYKDTTGVKKRMNFVYNIKAMSITHQLQKTQLKYCLWKPSYSEIFPTFFSNFWKIFQVFCQVNVYILVNRQQIGLDHQGNTG